MTERGALTDPSPGNALEGDPIPPSRSRLRDPRWWVVAIAIVVLAAVAMNRTSSSTHGLDKAEVAGIVDDAVGKAADDIRNAPARSAEVYDQIVPSLVVIRSDRTGSGGDGAGLGTGVVINEKGAILTALHVVDGATGLRVSFADGTESRATIASSDAANDIAVLIPERLPAVLVPAVIGGGIRVGDEAFVVGHPLGLVGSITGGVVSGIDRTITRDNGRTLRGLIQFDAAVNPGSSGGPLLNRDGQVVGIVTALANPARDGYFTGIGFAVPMSTAGGAAGAPPQ
ncbi:MAG TPA: trypsin-like peptidase domain-containing protein [Acidimicrobiales bacterium]|nr:trypsin-like peptidase domain-containing protein [Acidimicrobiales bacterium]